MRKTVNHDLHNILQPAIDEDGTVVHSTATSLGCMHAAFYEQPYKGHIIGQNFTFSGLAIISLFFNASDCKPDEGKLAEGLNYWRVRTRVCA